MHGGADGSGAPSGSKNGNYKHGLYTAEGPAGRAVLFRHGVRQTRRGGCKFGQHDKHLLYG
jgi:hypothetical protein